MPFLRRAARVWALVGATALGLFYWYMLSHHERYLQPLVPWMAAVAAASVVLAWQQRGATAKAALASLVALELVWGADSYFFPHMMLGDAPIRATASWIGTGFRGELEQRKQFARPLQSIGAALPAGARVLLHEHNPRLGLSAPVIMDMPQFQTGISYQDLRSPREVHDLYRRLGVTHIVYEKGASLGADNLAGDLRFWQFAINHTTAPRQYDGFVLAELPRQPPEARAGDRRDRALYLGCAPDFGRGLHPLEALGSDSPHPVPAELPWPSSAEARQRQAARADWLVTDSNCAGSAPPAPLFDGFIQAARRGSEELWVRALVAD